MLGPVRFTHIQDCAREVCQVFRVEDEMQDCISTLQSLDDILADLRGELAKIKEEADSQPDYRHSKSEAGSHPAKDYSALRKSLDTAKARRQISAREKAIESVKKLINEQREATSSALAPGQNFHRVVSMCLKEVDPCSANSYLTYPQLLQFTVYQVFNLLG